MDSATWPAVFVAEMVSDDFRADNRFIPRVGYKELGAVLKRRRGTSGVWSETKTSLYADHKQDWQARMSADDVYAANHQPSPVGAIVRMLEQMQQADVDFAVMVCNTAHIHFDEIRSRSPIKLLHIIENAALRSRDAGAGRAGLLATTPTVASGIYERYFSSTGRQLSCPDPAHQQRVMDAIFHPGYGLKATNTTVSDLALDELRAAAEQRRSTDGVETLVLGCTELSMAIPGDTWHGFRIIDPVRLLAQASLEHAGYATARP